MATENGIRGRLGESLTCEYLVNKGYRLIARSYRKPWGEIGVVGKDRDDTLVFFEVKTLGEGGPESLMPEDNVNTAKLKKLRKTCQAFARENRSLVNGKKDWRIDLVAVALGDDEVPYIRHYESI